MAAAQSPPPDSLAPLEQSVLKATADWQLLAKDLDTRVARMLPCDPRTKAAIDAVVKASQNRLTAQAQYYQAAQALAQNRSEGAKRLLASEEARGAAIAADKVHDDAATAAVENMLAEVTAAARVQPPLDSAQTALQQIAAMVKQRLQLVQDSAERRAAVLDSLRSLATAYQARETAVKEATAAFESERGKWDAYYKARSQRAFTECALTGAASRGPAVQPTAAPKPAAVRAPPAQGKQ